MAEYGFSREKIHFQVVLEPDGTLVSLDDIRDRNDEGQTDPQARCSSPTAGAAPGSG